MWFLVPVSNPDRLALSVGQWQVGVDNSVLKITGEAVAGMASSLPVQKSWQGKLWSLTSATASADGSRVYFGIDVHKNPLPLAVVVAGLGIVGGVVAAVFLVKELRRWLPLADLSKSALPYVAAVVVSLFGVVLLVRALRGFK